MYEEYEKCEDSELIARFRAGEESVMEYICSKYRGLVMSKVTSMFLLGGEKDDLIQEGMIGLFKAVIDYKPECQTSFTTFANLCINRQLYTAIKRAGRSKHIPLNTYISLCTEKDQDDGKPEEGDKLGALSAEDVSPSPEQILLDREHLDELERDIQTMLSDFEKQVMELMVAGLRPAEMAEILDKEEKGIYNACQRIRKKIREVLIHLDQ